MLSIRESAAQSLPYFSSMFRFLMKMSPEASSGQHLHSRRTIQRVHNSPPSYHPVLGIEVEAGSSTKTWILNDLQMQGHNGWATSMFNYLSNSFIKINPLPRSLGAYERVTHTSINNMSKSAFHTCASPFVSRIRYEQDSSQYREAYISDVNSDSSHSLTWCISTPSKMRKPS